MRKILSKGLAAPGPAKMFGLGNPGPQALSGPVVVVNGLPEKVRPVRRRAAPEQLRIVSLEQEHQACDITGTER